MNHPRTVTVALALAVLLAGCAESAGVPVSTPAAGGVVWGGLGTPPPDADSTPVREYTCNEVGGVFQQNYEDGRGVCVPADPRAKCHSAEDRNAITELNMTPDTADGTIDYPFLIGMASNKDCWKQPNP